jgi:multidrug efflux pump subunit AcrA (membrane-fusion protein)
MFVWTVAADSTAHRANVSIGATNGNHVAITDGLDMGQRVVTEGYQKLSEGTKVIY